MKMLRYINTRGNKLSLDTKSRVIIFSQCVNHPNTFIQGQYVFYYTEYLMIQVCIMLLEGQLLKKLKVIN